MSNAMAAAARNRQCGGWGPQGPGDPIWPGLTLTQRLVAVLKHDTFVYDVASNQWSKVETDERIYGHDARSAFAYFKKERFVSAGLSTKFTTHRLQA